MTPDKDLSPFGLVFRYVIRSGPDGATVDELMTRTGLNRKVVKEVLDWSIETAGTIKKNEDGRYVSAM